MRQGSMGKITNVVNSEREIKKQFLIRVFNEISKHHAKTLLDASIHVLKTEGYTEEEAKIEVRKEYRKVLHERNDIVSAIKGDNSKILYTLNKLIGDNSVDESDPDKLEEEYRRLRIDFLADEFSQYDFAVKDDIVIAGSIVLKQIEKVYTAHEVVKTLLQEEERGAKKAKGELIIPDNVLNESQPVGFIEKEQPQQQRLIPPNILSKLQDVGFIENATAHTLKWLKSKSLLAYFVEVANDKLDLKHGQQRQIKPFETMFNVTGLTSSINDYKKTGQLPIGHKIVDKILDNTLI